MREANCPIVKQEKQTIEKEQLNMRLIHYLKELKDV
jgi:hypothetical protein